MAKKKKHTSPQTRIKQQRAAKSRHRAPKNSPHAGEFTGEFHAKKALEDIFHHTVGDARLSRTGRIMMGAAKLAPGIDDEHDMDSTVDPDRVRTNRSTKLGSETVEQFIEHRTFALRERNRSKFPHLTPDEMTSMIADQISEEIKRESFPGLGSSHHVDQGYIKQRMGAMRSENKDQRNERVDRDELWRTHGGHLTNSPVPQGPIAASELSSTPRSAGNIRRQIKAEQPSHDKWITEQLQDPTSSFYGADKAGRDDQGRSTWAARRRLENYLKLVAAGRSSEDAMNYLSQENRGAPNATDTAKINRYSSEPDGKEAWMRKQATQDIQNRAKTGKSETQYGLKDKYKSGDPGMEGFGVNIQVPGVDSIDTLRKRFPDLPEMDLIKYQETQRQTVYQHSLAANERWTHELRAERLLGGKHALQNQGKDAQYDNGQAGQVVVFTTNLGGPNLSVNSHSLLGQYVIKKRKKMVVDDKIASRGQVMGEFPSAVRDQHLIEVSLGGLGGAQGRYGLYQNTGWKKGSKRSKGYGKQVPVGSQVLRDSNGAAVYDKDGNVRYTEGYSRPFTVSTNTLGLRIFVG